MTHLLTFRAYGTHLPGDQRGWVDRTRGEHRGGWREPSAALERHAREAMSDPIFVLDRHSAQIVLSTMREVCAARDGHLLAAHIRSDHAHCIVEGVSHPNRAIGDFKAYASRALNVRDGDRRRWSRGGNARCLHSAAAVEAAVRSVADGQGAAMAVYVWRREDAYHGESPLSRAGL